MSPMLAVTVFLLEVDLGIRITTSGGFGGHGCAIDASRWLVFRCLIEFVMLAPIITCFQVLSSTFHRREKFKLLVRLSPPIVWRHLLLPSISLCMNDDQ